jgi:hypothetical protein
MAALQQGRTVRFTTLAAALADLSRQESAPALERRLRRYTSVDLLVLDELGYLPCDGPSADLLRTFAACPMGAPGSTASRQPRAPPVDAAGVHCAFPARRSRQVSVHAETLRQRRQEGAP